MACGVDPGYLSKLLNGKQDNPGSEVVWRMSFTLAMKVDPTNSKQKVVRLDDADLKRWRSEDLFRKQMRRHIHRVILHNLHRQLIRDYVEVEGHVDDRVKYAKIALSSAITASKKRIARGEGTEEDYQLVEKEAIKDQIIKRESYQGPYPFLNYSGRVALVEDE
jgi:transcriptional regulator with XRE-family HTH domain